MKSQQWIMDIILYCLKNNKYEITTMKPTTDAEVT